MIKVLFFAECGAPSSPLNGALVANGKTANYSCDTGHTLLGTQVRTCNTDGTGWSSYDPQCSEYLDTCTLIFGNLEFGNILG
jgi:hypothetical protein